MNLNKTSSRTLLSIFSLLVFLTILPNALQAQKKRALLIGISNYPTYSDPNASWSEIHGVNDVKRLQKILKEQGFLIDLLTNEKASHNGIVSALNKLVKVAKEGDIIYIHLSGHGQAVEDEDNDEEDGWDEAFIPYDAQRCYQASVYTGKNHLLDDELYKHLKALRKKVGEKGIVYVVIDACHAGSSYRGDEIEDSVFVRGTDVGFSKNGKTYAPRIDKRGNYRVQSEDGMAPVYMLEACRSYEVNSEIKQDNTYYGPMSWYISQQLLTTPLSFDTKWIENVRKKWIWTYD